MTTLTLDRETSRYWELIRTADRRSKLMLITLLSSSLAEGDDSIAIAPRRPLRASRPGAMTDEQMEQEMTGQPVPLGDTQSDVSAAASSSGTSG